MPINYKEIREMRKLIIDEMQNEFISLTVEHYQLAEMRIQTALQAEIHSSGIAKEKLNWKKLK